MLVIKQLMVPIDFHSISFSTMEISGDQQLFGSSEFFKIYFFVLNIRDRQIWNDKRVSKYDTIFIFGWNVPLLDQNFANMIYASYAINLQYVSLETMYNICIWIN